MKITQLAATQSGEIGKERFLPVAADLQLLFVGKKSDAEDFRDTVRHFYYGNELSNPLSRNHERKIEFAFQSGKSMGYRSGSGIRWKNQRVNRELENTLREIDFSTYRVFYDINFLEGECTGHQLFFQLKKRFNVPVGDFSIGSTMDRQTQKENLKEGIAQINQGVFRCRAENDSLHQRLEDLEKQKAGTNDFGISQKKALSNRIEKLRQKLEGLRRTVFELEDSIELTAQNANPSRSFKPQMEGAGEGWFHVKSDNQKVAERLGSIDEKITRWENIRTDVDGRLAELKGDLGTGRVGEFDNMFDDVREMLRFSEDRILQLIDSTNETNLLGQQLNALVELNHRIFDSLCEIQEQWREEIFKGEVESLSRCSKDLGGYLGRLNAKRNRLIDNQWKNGRSIGGQTAMHQGREQSNLEHVEHLNSEYEQVLEEINLTESLLAKANEEWGSLKESSDLAGKIELVRERILSCNHEHSLLQDEKDRLLKQLSKLMIKEKQNSHLVQLISSYALQLTAGHLTRVFLSEKESDIELVDSEGNSSTFQAADGLTQSKIRMAISLGCAAMLADSGFSVPLIWQDNFSGFELAEVRKMLPALSDFSRYKGQLILLTGDQAVKQVLMDNNISCHELLNRRIGDEPSAIPTEKEISTTVQDGIPVISGDCQDVNLWFDLAAMDQYGRDSEYKAGITYSCDSKSQVRETPVTNSNGRFVDADHLMNEISGLSLVERAAEGKKKFYLELSSRVEAAPEIGPKTAEMLERTGICTVSDLINQDCSWIASELNHQRYKAEDIKRWQQQALLVCKIPNLRGHDAQLLVACEVTRAEDLAEMDPDLLFEVIGPFSRTKAGKKLLRGSTEPDLTEVRNWVTWASSQKNLRNAA